MLENHLLMVCNFYLILKRIRLSIYGIMLIFSLSELLNLAVFLESVFMVAIFFVLVFFQTSQKIKLEEQQ